MKSLLTLTFLGIIAQSQAQVPSQAEVILYASPFGMMSASGISESSPLPLLKAKALAESTLKSGASVTLILLPGTYRLRSPLSFTTAANGLKVMGKPNTNVELSGGIVIDHWEQRENFVYEAKLPSQGLSFRQIYAKQNGSNYPRPSRAHSRIGMIESWNDDGSFLIRIEPLDLTQSEFNEPYPELVVHRDWVQSRLRVKRIEKLEARNENSLTLYRVTPVPEDSKRELEKTIPLKKSGQMCFIENHPDFFKKTLLSNQWYFDQTKNTLQYFSRTQNPNQLEMTIPILEKLIDIDGTKNLTLENIIFTDTTWNAPSKEGFTGVQASFYENPNHDWISMPGAIVAKNTENLKLIHNQFLNLGGTGLELSHHTLHSLVDHNHFTAIAGTGIAIHTALSETGSKDDTIQNNTVDHAGLDYFGSVGIFATYPDSLAVLHNEVHSLPYTGISVGWGWTSSLTSLKNNHIAYNSVHHVMQALDDGGGIYVMSNQPGTVIENNLIQDINPSPSAGRRPLVPLYLDNESAGMTVKNNACIHNAEIQANSPGLFFREEAAPLNQIENCQGPTAQFQFNVGPVHFTK